MGKLLRSLVFPLLLVASVWATIAAMRLGVPTGVAAVAAIFVSAWPLLILEGLAPHRQDWRRPLLRSGLDVVHMLTTAAATETFRAVGFGLMLWVAASLTGWLDVSLWPTEAPVAVQLALALIIGDLGAYGVHRLAHAGPLWPIHAMHHSSEKLSTLSSGRNHPFNAVAAYASQVTPLILLGAGIEALAALSVFTAVHGMLQHCNADIRHGWLNYVFATAEVHRWHHSSDFHESNTNFGSNLVLWDHVFGTWSVPHGTGPARVGLDDLQMPDNYWVHLASPFSLARWTRSGEPEAPASSGSSAG